MQLIALKYACCMADLGGGAGAQPSYMQMAPPPVHPGAPVTDRGFTGPGGAAGGARRRLAGKLFERQHSLQDPSFDPVSEKLGLDEVTFGLTYLLATMCGLRLLPFWESFSQGAVVSASGCSFFGQPAVEG